MDLGLTDRACIVTGGSRGIGLQVARQLVAEGARVLLVGRGEEALSQAAEQCEGDARTVSWLALDITEPDAGERAVAACRERFETVDVVVNGAGMSQVRAIEALTDEEWQAMWEIHVMGPMRLMRAAIPEMAGRGWGRIVNVSSSSGKRWPASCGSSPAAWWIRPSPRAAGRARRCSTRPRPACPCAGWPAPRRSPR